MARIRPRLVLGSDGNFYGTTYGAAAAGYGTVFRVTTNGVLTTLVSFSPRQWRRIRRPDLCWAVTAISTARPIWRQRQSWDGVPGDGQRRVDHPGLVPSATDRARIHRPDWCWAVTAISTARREVAAAATAGTVFKVTTNGVLTSLVSFNHANGAYPAGRTGVGQGRQFLRHDAGIGFWHVRLCGTVFGDYQRGVDHAGLVQRLANGGIRMPDWCWAVTAISTARPRSGGSGGDGTVFQVTTNGVLTTLVSFNRRQWRGSTGRTGVGQRRQFLRHDRVWRQQQGSGRCSR